MDDEVMANDGTTCPHVNRDDPRCSSRFSVDRLEQAFSVCFGAFHACPMYHRISHELILSDRRAPAKSLITLTANGRVIPLRATGT